MTNSNPQPETLAAAIAKHGISIRAEFVPFSQSRNAKEKLPSLNWRVTLKRRSPIDGQDWDILTTDYSAGQGHCPAYTEKSLGMSNSIDRIAAIRWECEHGRIRGTVNDFSLIRSSNVSRVILPETPNVIASLLMDSDTLDYGTFEEWARDMGYEEDSRKAESIYRACLEIALKFRKGLGESIFADLREAAQDY